MREGANLIFGNDLFHLGASEMRVELDKKSLFALASDTRLEILKSLQPMRRTVSQLSESLNIDKAAVYRHLKKMEEGGLVKRYEDHGFVYYGLSWKARDLLSPNENTRIVVLLSASWILTMIVAFFVAAVLVTSPSELIFGDDYGTAKGGDPVPTDSETSYRQELIESISENPMAWMVWGVLVACCTALACVFYFQGFRTLRKPKQRSTAKPEPLPEPDPDED